MPGKVSAKYKKQVIQILEKLSPDMNIEIQETDTMIFIQCPEERRIIKIIPKR